MLQAFIFQNECHSPYRTTDSYYLISFNTETAALRQHTFNQVVMKMKTAEPLLSILNVIWVVDDMFWLAVAVSFDFLFTCTYLERLAECFVQCAISGLLLTSLMYRASWNPAGKVYAERSYFSHLDHHWPFHKIVLSNLSKIAVLMVETESEVVLLPWFVFVSMLRMLMMHVGGGDSVVAGVARLGVFFRHILRLVYGVFWPAFLLECSMKIWHSLEQS